MNIDTLATIESEASTAIKELKSLGSIHASPIQIRTLQRTLSALYRIQLATEHERERLNNADS